MIPKFFVTHFTIISTILEHFNSQVEFSVTFQTFRKLNTPFELNGGTKSNNGTLHVISGQGRLIIIQITVIFRGPSGQVLFR